MTMSDNVNIIMDIQGMGKIEGELDAIEGRRVAAKERVEMTKEQIKAEIDKAQSTFDGLKVKIDHGLREAWRKMNEAEIHAARVALKAINIAQRAFGFLNQVLNAFGVTLPPMVSATVTFLFSTVTNFVTLAAQYFAQGYINPWAIAGAILSLASSAIAFGMAIKSQIEAENVTKQIEQAKMFASQQGGSTATIDVIL